MVVLISSEWGGGEDQIGAQNQSGAEQSIQPFPVPPATTGDLGPPLAAKVSTIDSHNNRNSKSGSIQPFPVPPPSPGDLGPPLTTNHFSLDYRLTLIDIHNHIADRFSRFPVPPLRAVAP